MNSSDSFERLVSGISSDERLALFEKLSNSANHDVQNLDSHPCEQVERITDLSKKLQTEPFLVRLWLLIKSLFTGVASHKLYNSMLVNNIARNISKRNPDVLDNKHLALLSSFYINLHDLQKAADFFKQGISCYEDEPGVFFLFLGSLIIPDVYNQIETDANPYSIPFTKEASNELRASLFRKQEDLLQSIQGVQKSRMYIAIQSLDWLRQFTHLPFEKLLARFSSFASGVYTCPIEVASTELAQFAKVMCNVKSVPTEVIETLYMLSIKAKAIDSIGLDKVMDASEYQEKSLSKLSVIMTFIKSIPIKSITMVSFGSALWCPESIEGTEDWFVKFKNQWKKKFDASWDMWIDDRKREQIFSRIKDLFGCSSCPDIPHRPWTEAWGGISCSKTYTLGFLYGFFTILYPFINKVFKVLMIEGEFLLKENRVDFTDVYNEFNHTEQALLSLDSKLSINGVYYSTMNNISKDKVRTIQGQSRMNSLMLSIETEAGMISSQFGTLCRKINPVLTAILLNRNETPKTIKEGKYASLANFGTINGKNNVQFRQDLQKVAIYLENSLNLLKDIEGIEEIVVRK